ncbi:DUF5420 family protein [Escherichia coli]|uniref:DUF5420 family protein n=1 Tax=Escherichia coli TaxID=562 RepID=UPI001824418D|nr:DUF5420 family protein [Escherichia coli]EFB2278472.1 hypothetical protein [Escherichia coli]ELR7143641.1 DUF5420 family protein [Escherichia coli]
MTVKQYFFKMNKENSLYYWRKWQDSVGKERKMLIREFLEKSHARGYLYSSVFGDMAVTAILVPAGVDTGRNKRIAHKSIDEDGNALFSVTPDRRYKEGRKLDKDIQQLNTQLKRLPGFSAWLISEIDCYFEADWIVNGRDSVTWSAAGFYPEKDVVVVRIPVPSEEIAWMKSRLHPSLIEIKRSEFIALTEE